jgi:hypothetical protein
VVYFLLNFFNPALVIYIKPFIIPTFIIYVLNNNFNKLTLSYYLYVLFFYLNELLICFGYIIIALVASFFCYLALVNLGYNAIKTKKPLYQKDFHFYTSYELRVFLIAILYILMSVIGDNFLNIILVFNSIVAVFLGLQLFIFR